MEIFMIEGLYAYWLQCTLMGTLIGRSSKRELMKKTSDQRGGGRRVIFKNDQQLVVKVEGDAVCKVFYLYLLLPKDKRLGGGISIVNWINGVRPNNRP